MFLVKLAADETAEMHLRLNAAAIAVKYIHPALSAMAVQTQTITAPTDNTPLLDILSERLGRLSAPASQPLTITSEPITEKDSDDAS